MVVAAVRPVVDVEPSLTKVRTSLARLGDEPDMVLLTSIIADA